MKVAVMLMLIVVTTTMVWADNEIIINEIMYNSNGTDVEFVELYNLSGSSVNLENWYILDDNDNHIPCKLSYVLNSGEYLVVAGSIAQFEFKYPGITNINPNEFSTGGQAWSLGNAGDAVRLFDNSNNLQDIVEYNDGGSWPSSPDGNGPSLELLNPALDNSLPTSWDPSAVDGGTPGKINSVYTENVEPTCKNGERLIALPKSTDAVTVTVLAFDNEGLAKVELFVDVGSGFNAQLMNDNGTDGDAVAGDSLYSTIIAPQSNNTLVRYFAVATDDIGQQDSWPNQAPTEYHAYTVGYTPPKIRINEILAVNNSINKDEFGEYDDWFEIHNEESHAINLGGMYVSNSLGSPQAFELPPYSLAAGEYLVIWADGDTQQGMYHVDFKLSSAGEAVGIFETIHHGNVLVHGWQYGLMSADVSMGYNPENGIAPEYLNSPTPGASNETSTLFSPVCINEFETTSDFGGPDDWIEIYNRGNQAFDLSGCFLSDQRSDNTKWSFPNGTILQPHDYLVIYEDVLNFGLSSGGDDVIMLTAADSTTGLDFYDFNQQIPDKSEGRYPDGTSSWQKFDTPTKGAANIGVSDVKIAQNSIPTEFALYQNFPNPFNPTTTIKYDLAQKSMVTITIYDMLGKQVRNLVQNQQVPGHHSIIWDSRDNIGNFVCSGVYFYKIQAGSFLQTRKMILIR